ncbi:unnamed protein product [Prorocentrum cordatum]|uniref:Uncharacterized protein n=1 Tax=Prorocentrum cordatum TaxID=2364126 RepID=A0ABN9R3Q5_9DINO|nr:unnamed protein product [Polarella glacialis]
MLSSDALREHGTWEAATLTSQATARSLPRRQPSTLQRRRRRRRRKRRRRRRRIRREEEGGEGREDARGSMCEYSCQSFAPGAPRASGGSWRPTATPRFGPDLTLGIRADQRPKPRCPAPGKKHTPLRLGMPSRWGGENQTPTSEDKTQLHKHTLQLLLLLLLRPERSLPQAGWRFPADVATGVTTQRTAPAQLACRTPSTLAC